MTETTTRRPDVFIRRCISAAFLRSALSRQGHDTPPAPRLTLRSSDCQSFTYLASTQPHATVLAPARRTRGRQTTASTWERVSTASTPGAMRQTRLLLRSNGSGVSCCNRRCDGTALQTTSANGGTIRFTARLSRAPMIFPLHRGGDDGLRRLG